MWAGYLSYFFVLVGALRRNEYQQMSLFPGHSKPVGGAAACSLASEREHGILL